MSRRIPLRPLILGGAIIIAVAAVALLTDVLGSGPLTMKHTLVGSIELRDSDPVSSPPWIDGTAASCVGAESYGEFHGGAALTVSDAGGTLLATGALGPGTGGPPHTCRFEFQLVDVLDASVYQLDVGQRHVGSFKYVDMQVSDWTIHVVIGS
jgi:hypothetical protein